MKILFIFHMAELRGGASKSGLTLVKGLKEKGVEIVAVCPKEGDLSEALRKSGIEVKIFGYEWAYPYFQRTPAGAIKFVPKLLLQKVRNRKALRRLIDFAKEFRPDIIHTNTGVADIGIKTAENIGVPHLSHYREFGWKDCSAIMWHEPRMNRYPRQHAIAIGKEILDFHSRGNNDIRLIYNGIVSASDIKMAKDKENVILYVGVLSKMKGIEDLLRAYSMLAPELRRIFRLKIAGTPVDADYDTTLRQLAGNLGVADTVEWLGERNDVADLMLRARVLVAPSHHEAFGRIVVEAMAAGCPVIGRDSDGIKEQFDNGLRLTGEEIGLRFTSVSELAARLAEVLKTEPEEFQPMIKRAQSAVESLYTGEKYVEQVEDYYNFIVKQ